MVKNKKQDFIENRQQVGRTTTNTDNKHFLDNIDNITKDKQIKQIDNSKEHTKLIDYYNDRSKAMRSERSIYDKTWNDKEIQYKAHRHLNRKGMASHNAPIEFALVEHYRAEENRVKYRPELIAQNKADINAVKILSKINDWDHVQNDNEQEYIKDTYSNGIFGFGVLFDGYQKNNRILRYRDINNNELETKLETKAGLKIRSLNPWNCYIDNRAGCIEDAQDFIYDEFISKEKFESLKYDPIYMNLDRVSHVNSTDSPSNKSIASNKTGGIFYKLSHMFDKQNDLYMTIANDNTIIRLQELPYWHKELPISWRNYTYSPFSMYGRGLCEIALQYKSTINSLHEMLMDAVNRSNNETIALGSGLDFDGQTFFGYKNTIVRFNGELDQNFKQLTGTPPNQAAFAYLEDVRREMATAVGFDIQSLFAPASEKAFQTAVKQQLAKLRINISLQNRDTAYKRLTRLHIQNIQQYYPKGLINKLVPITSEGADDSNLAEPMNIMLEGEEFNKKTKKFIKKKGQFEFTVKPEMLETNQTINVKVITNYDTPTLKELEKENLKDFITFVAELSQLSQTTEQLRDNFGAIFDMAREKFNIEIDGITDDDDIEQGKQKFQMILSQLNNAIGTTNSGTSQINFEGEGDSEEERQTGGPGISLPKAENLI